MAAILLVGVSDPTWNGLDVMGLFIVSTIPFLIALIALVIRAVGAAEALGVLLVGRVAPLLVLHPIILAAIVLVDVMGWAFHARFALSRTALDSAVRAPAPPPNTIRWIGLFKTQGM